MAKYIFLISSFVVVFAFFNSNAIFAQCGADGTQPCGAPAKQPARKTPAKPSPKPVTKPVSITKPKTAEEIAMEESVRQAKIQYDKAWSDCPQVYSDSDVEALKCKIGYMTKAIVINPKFEDAFNMRAYWNRKLGKADDAVEDYTRGTELLPRKFENYYFRGAINFERAPKTADASKKKAFYEQALADFSKVIELKPDDYDSLRYRGNIYVWREDFDKAIDDLNNAIKLMLIARVPYPEDFYYDRGLAFLRRADKRKTQSGENEETKRDYDAAIQDFTKAVSLQPQKRHFYAMRGYTFYQQDNFAVAVRDLTTAIEKNQSNPDKFSVYWRGMAYEKLGKYDLAAADKAKYKELTK